MATMEEIRKASDRAEIGGRRRCDPAALRVGLSDAAGASQSFGHRHHPRCHRVAVGWSDHTRGPAVIERAVHHWNAAVGGIPSRSRWPRRGIRRAAIAGCPKKSRPSSRASAKQLLPTARASKGRSLPNWIDREWRADPADGMRPLRHIRRSMETRRMTADGSGIAHRCRHPGAHGLDTFARQGAEADRGQATALAYRAAA